MTCEVVIVENPSGEVIVFDDPAPSAEAALPAEIIEVGWQGPPGPPGPSGSGVDTFVTDPLAYYVLAKN